VDTRDEFDAVVVEDLLVALIESVELTIIEADVELSLTSGEFSDLSVVVKLSFSSSWLSFRRYNGVTMTLVIENRAT
jgi:hypothetical protein